MDSPPPKKKTAAQWLSGIMVRGMIAILPSALTLYILYWLVRSAETILGNAIKVVLPEGWYLPGMGLLVGMFLIFCLGLFVNAFLFRRILTLGEEALNRIPVVKTLYGSVKDFIGFFAQKKSREFHQVVALEMNMGGVPMRLIGFVTCSDFRDLPEGMGKEDEIAVYLPLSYQIGGYTLIVPRSAVRPIDISTNRAMGFVVTGGMFQEKGKHRPFP
jgi:uncharacterized membrane protein